MLTSVFISNEKVTLVQGNTNKKNIKIKNYVSRALPTGSMLNGIITNDAAVKTVLTRLCQEKRLPKKDIRLVIDSGSVVTKLVQVPVLSQKKLMEFTVKTFSDVSESYEKLIYDYSVIKERNKEGGGTILCSAVETSLIESYIELFKSLGVQLFSINIATNCILKLSSYLNELSKQTYIITTLDGNTAVSLLFVNGQYSFTSRQRLMSMRGSEESITELGGVISSLIQFNQSQKTGAEITNVYICGLLSNESELCAGISSGLNVTVGSLQNPKSIVVKSKLRSSFWLSDYLPAVGNLIIK
ncbi:MAG: pilus assembly protein PilM [Hydrogenoanaerobacterium sp.]